MKHNVKLSKRLQQIEKMVTYQYDHIWDCCCDHGLLGFSLLSHQTNSMIHFVDIVPELMAKVESKLTRFYSSSIWKTHCLDVAKLPLTQYEGRHLIIISGVGGDLMVEFITAIYQQHQNINIDFLLCPVHHQFSLRQKLIALNFSLKDEVLIEDNQRFYEILLVSSFNKTLSQELGDKNRLINPVGNKIWQSASSEQTEVVDKYWHKTLNHYLRIQQGSMKNNENNVQYIIDAYKAIML